MNSVSTLGHHAALQSQDNIDVVPLTYESRHILETSSAVSEREQDPFANLSAPVPQLTISPFDDVHAAPDSISPASPTLSTPTKEGLRRYRTRRPSPPRPLNLPPPRSPPPIFLMEEGEGDNSQDATTDVRWWHEWLCGCGEGPDRGGDVQVRRFVSLGYCMLTASRPVVQTHLSRTIYSFSWSSPYIFAELLPISSYEKRYMGLRKLHTDNV